MIVLSGNKIVCSLGSPKSMFVKFDRKTALVIKKIFGIRFQITFRFGSLTQKKEFSRQEIKGGLWKCEDYPKLIILYSKLIFSPVIKFSSRKPHPSFKMITTKDSVQGLFFIFF